MERGCKGPAEEMPAGAPVLRLRACPPGPPWYLTRGGSSDGAPVRSWWLRRSTANAAAAASAASAAAVLQPVAASRAEYAAAVATKLSPLAVLAPARGEHWPWGEFLGLPPGELGGV